MALDSIPQLAIERYRSFVIVPEDDSLCWGWQGRLVSVGYPIVCVGKFFRIYAHRLSYTIHKGTIPDGLFVCHHCDNPPCTNPAHLFLGTARDNARDRDSKGRGARKLGQPSISNPELNRGSAHARAKLTEATAIEMVRRYRAGGVFQKTLAAEYGVHPSIVSEVINGKRWKHIQGSGS